MKAQAFMVKAVSKSKNLNDWVSRLSSATNNWLGLLAGSSSSNSYRDIILAPTSMWISTAESEYQDLGVKAYDLTGGIRGSLSTAIEPDELIGIDIEIHRTIGTKTVSFTGTERNDRIDNMLDIYDYGPIDPIKTPLAVKMGEGDDSIDLAGLLGKNHKKSTYSTGDGNDHVEFTNVRFHSITTGQGLDRVELRSETFEYHGKKDRSKFYPGGINGKKIDLGEGNDLLYINMFLDDGDADLLKKELPSFIRKIDLGEGDDIIRFNTTHRRQRLKAAIYTGKGTDIVSIGNSLTVKDFDASQDYILIENQDDAIQYRKLKQGVQLRNKSTGSQVMLSNIKNPLSINFVKRAETWDGEEADLKLEREFGYSEFKILSDIF